MTNDNKTEWPMQTELRTKVGIAIVLGLLILCLCLLALTSYAQSRFSYKREMSCATTFVFSSTDNLSSVNIDGH